ncbi:uncharacterized protein LOC127849534 [Dreissena polymorpha]|uniref:Uncharacterized protein n=1 Tax=Dreissena polymorpha TaxID=45954 RepID=A0A9D4D285_DREPO|nr:uncharacterized protein LOC127849534 [Dreissena polymorpha]KAH3736640.1 hypothetical protein DPMN_043212 [Dreissena polymorpha]
MGVDIQTYRRRIGSFRCTKGEIISDTGQDSKIKNNKGSCQNRGVLTITLVIVLLMFAIGNVGQNELWNLWEDMLPILVIKVQLLISGVELNPGPGCLTDVKADNSHLKETALCDRKSYHLCDKNIVGKGTVQSKRPTQDGKTHERVEADTHKRKTCVYFGKVEPCTGSIKVDSIFGTKVFKIGLTIDLQKGLRNKNNTSTKGFAISRILDELCHFGKFVEMEIPPLLYLRKRNAFMVLPSDSWWNELQTSAKQKLQTAVLAFRNEFKQSFYICDKHMISMLDKHISIANVPTLNFCDITDNESFWWFSHDFYATVRIFTRMDKNRN